VNTSLVQKYKNMMDRYTGDVQMAPNQGDVEDEGDPMDMDIDIAVDARILRQDDHMEQTASSGILRQESTLSSELATLSETAELEMMKRFVEARLPLLTYSIQSDGLLANQPNVATDASQRPQLTEAHYVCPVPGCGSTFTRQFNLRGHMRSHNEEMP
jgi:hypothetical protein